MLDKIIRFSLNNRLLILLSAVLLTFGGLYTSQRAEVDVFPDLNAPTVVVMTEAGGMATEEVEQLVTFPIETAMNGSTGVRRVRSSSTMGFSVVWVEFEWDTDIYQTRQIVTEKLAAIRESLPANIGQPTIGPQSSILGELLIVGLTSEQTSALELRSLADWTLRPRLLSIGGVAQVSVLGGDVKEYQILFDPGKMKHYGVSLQEMMDAVQGMNRNINGGVMNQYGNEYIVRGIVATNRVDDIARSVVKTVEGSPISLSDIAEVRIGAQEPKLGTASEKGRPAVLLTITKQPNTNTLQLTEDIDKVISDIQKDLPTDVTVSTDAFRQSRFIESSISNIKSALMEGALFVVIILALFLGNGRTTIISLITIPLSLLVTVIVLHAMGMSLNTMSLGGMAIAIGSLVDDSIVDVENVWRRLRKAFGTSAQTDNKATPSADAMTTIYEASREVRMPILNSTLIIVASFLPLFFLSGMEGKMLIPLGIAFVVALFASTAVALTLTPVLCSYLLPTAVKNDQISKDSFLTHWIVTYYKRALEYALKHNRMVLGGTFALLVIAGGLSLRLGHSFLPPFNEGSLTINISTLPGVSLEESNKIGLQAEHLLMSIPEIKTVARKTGRAELDEHALGVNVSEIEAPFELEDRSQAEVLAEVRQKLSVIVGANIEIGQPISHRIDAMLSGTQANIAIKLFGDNLNRIFALGNEIKETIEDVPGIADLNVEQQIERPELKIVPYREMLLRQGISLPEFNAFIAANMAGEVVSQVNEGNRSYNLIVRSNAASRRTMDDVRSLMIDTRDGRKIPLTDVAEVTSSMGPHTINRENAKRKIVISANCSGRDLGSVVDDIRRRVDEQIVLPDGYHIEYGGQFESEQAASRTLLLTSLMSLLIIFVLLNTQFHNARESAVVLLNLPLALIGGIFALSVTTGELSIPAIIGFISLFGIATRNGMLLISHYNQLRSTEPLTLKECIVRGSVERINPIIMTALTSALALIPLAMRGQQPGNEIQSPMAKVILGGLLTATLLNAFVIPVVYAWMHRNDDANASISGTYTNNHRMPKSILLALLTCLFATPAMGQPRININAVLADIEAYNPRLLVKGQEQTASLAELRANNTIGPTTVEYSPFWNRNNVSGLASSELIVSQEFDFPTVYGMRKQEERLQRDIMQQDYNLVQRDILLEGRRLCLDLNTALQRDQLLRSRLSIADSLLWLCDRSLTLGRSTQLERNRVSLDRMSANSECAQNEALISQLRQQLMELGATEHSLQIIHEPQVEDTGEQPTTSATDATNYSPTLSETYAQAALKDATHNLKMAQQGWLPKLTLGYRRNTELKETLGGFMVGVSIPLLGNSRRIKAARLRQSAAEQELEAAKQQSEARRLSLLSQIDGQKKILQTYDSELLAHSLRLLLKAVKAGQITLSAYYTEADRIRGVQMEHLERENALLKLDAEYQALYGVR